MKVNLVSITPEAERIIAYCARVSSPNQDNPEIQPLLSYCIKHGHWSIFEMADMTVEIETSRAIAAQLLRHKSFSFQEFSQRYSVATEFEMYPGRRQDKKNRQNSIDDLPPEIMSHFNDMQSRVHELGYQLYMEALSLGIAKEQARFLLPLSTKTRLYMKGSIRSWIHYLKVRQDASTQKEHRDIANLIWDIFSKELPVISTTLSH